MARRNDVQILRDTLAARSPQRATVRQILADGDVSWSEEKLQSVIDRAVKDPTSHVHRGRGGTVEFIGSERGDSLLYRHVSRILETYWARSEGLRDVEVFNTARGGQRTGLDWTHPDLVLRALPRRRRSQTDAPDLHSFEVERPGAGKLVSVFQSFVQGRGANFSWVVIARQDLARSEQYERILWAADQVGIGVLSYGKPGSFTTWRTERPAPRRDPGPSERELFENAALRGR